MPYLLDEIGFIPNANRTYYLGRSQPPFFTLMVQLLAAEKGDAVLLKYQHAIEKEYAFWMEGEKTVGGNSAHRRVVRLPDGSILNRYWDDKDTPRPEAFLEDRELAEKAGGNPATVYRHIRAAAESGWDFSSRWFKDGNDMATIQTTNLFAVDLNCLLLFMEQTLLQIYSMTKAEPPLIQAFAQKTNSRTKAIRQYCYKQDAGFYVDYNFVNRQQNTALTLAAVYPLFFGIATTQEAEAVVNTIATHFLQEGGLLTTLNPTGQQWDAPNGWAPLQWMAYKGLKNYGHQRLAATI